ncbi:MAG TPA: NAD(P)-binding domain-containing protein [Casimicrobiaceae bacterium]|nr:NAD(P)-binding domain-containing protein [Casimicrobiaceae bacterium]
MSDFSLLTLAIYGIPLCALVAVYVIRRKRHESAAVRERESAIAAGLTEPASLHPIVDPARCVGSASCAAACPEQAIGLIDGKAQLTNPAACIGHGACAAACPVDAIKLVFGTERRGVDIPYVKLDFETNVRGIFIAGELGGMGLIRKSAEQGQQAILAIARRPRSSLALDVVIIGAGPAGIAAGLCAIEQKLRYRVIEQEDDLGGAVFHYPRNKIAMTAPVDLPVVGRVKFNEVSKETLLGFWQDIVQRAQLQISFADRMDRIVAIPGGYRIETTRGSYETGAVLLAIGRRGTPRKLEVPGEALPKVVYRLIEPAQYRGSRVLIVGGGDSAVEAALACAEEPQTEVTLAYRGEAFNRVKAKNRERLEAAQAHGRIDVRTGTEVKRILPEKVELTGPQNEFSLRNDAVIVQAGGVLPTAMLRELGVLVETKYGTA